MKYQIMNQSIPQVSRQELNDKILYLIDNDLSESSGITREDIYNAYTGDGGLHGLKYSDFDSYYEYSSAKKEIENGPRQGVQVHHGLPQPRRHGYHCGSHLWNGQLFQFCSDGKQPVWVRAGYQGV